MGIELRFVDFIISQIVEVKSEGNERKKIEQESFLSLTIPLS